MTVIVEAMLHTMRWKLNYLEKLTGTDAYCTTTRPTDGALYVYSVSYRYAAVVLRYYNFYTFL